MTGRALDDCGDAGRFVVCRYQGEDAGRGSRIVRGESPPGSP